MIEPKTQIEKLVEENLDQFAELDDKLLKEINYSRKQLETDVVHLKQWLKDQHHLPECRLREKDNFFSMFLTGCKGSLETSKKKLDAYYSLRGKTEAYTNRDPLDEDYRKTCEHCSLVIMPRLTKDGHILALFRLTKPEIPPNSFLNLLKRIFSIMEIGMRMRSINHSAIVITDYVGHTPAHAATFNASSFKDCLHLAQNIFPTRVKQLILINVPSFFELIINVFVRPVLKKKLRDRLIVTSGGCEELHKYVENAVLPKDWQGDYPLTLQEVNDIWNNSEIALRDWFINDLSQETDESKRIKPLELSNGEDSYFGVQGSLKKLVID